MNSPFKAVFQAEFSTCSFVFEIHFSLFRWSQGLMLHQGLVDCARAVILLPLGKYKSTASMQPEPRYFYNSSSGSMSKVDAAPGTGGLCQSGYSPATR